MPVLLHHRQRCCLFVCFLSRHTVTQLVEALHYKSESRRFDSRRGPWDFSFSLSFLPCCGPGVDSASNRNENQRSGCKGGWCVGLTTFPLSCADFLKILSLNILEISGLIQGRTEIAVGLFLNDLLPPLCMVFTLTYLQHTMSPGNTVLQLFCSYNSWCI
jgi:hypothetical protein